jgi:hypothetical protein
MLALNKKKAVIKLNIAEFIYLFLRTFYLIETISFMLPFSITSPSFKPITLSAMLLTSSLSWATKIAVIPAFFSITLNKWIIK